MLIMNLYYIHTEKYSSKSCVVNFDTQMSSGQSEEWTMVFTREKNDTSNQNRERGFFTCEKMIHPIRSHRGVWVARQNSHLFLQLGERHFAHIRGEKFFFCLSMYTINTIPHVKCFVRYLPTRCFCIRNLTRSLRSLVRFLIQKQLVCKYRMPALLSA